MSAQPDDEVQIVRFTSDDRYGGWKKGDLAECKGRVHPFIPLWILVLSDGQVLEITNPFGRGLIEEVE